jgi:serine/threonine-protein kinase 24/25/MST4
MWESNDTIRSDWNFDTVKSTSIMGTFSSVAKDLMPEMDDEDMGDEEPSIYEDDEGSTETGGAVSGSALLGSGGIGINIGAAHSTVAIKTPLDEPDISSLLAAAEGLENDSVDGAKSRTLPSHPTYDETPLGAPPAYTGSVRSAMRSSYAARHKMTGAGTIMREADLGSGVDTIRPVKRVDTASSLRLSAEYVGTRSRETSPSSPTTTPPKDRPSSSFKRRASDSERAGRAMIDDVVLPVLQNVSYCQVYRYRRITIHDRPSEMTWMLERLSHSV